MLITYYSTEILLQLWAAQHRLKFEIEMFLLEREKENETIPEMGW